MSVVSKASWRVFLLVGISFSVNADHPQGLNLGQPVTPQEIAAWDRGVMPDGQGLPPGQGSVSEGKAIYQQQCINCHGENGLGNSGDQLAGAIHSLTDEWPEQTIGTYWPYATTLFDFTRRSMPMTQPGSLSDDQVYAVVAYMLFLNRIIGEDVIMNAEMLKKIDMPNRDGFINIYEQPE